MPHQIPQIDETDNPSMAAINPGKSKKRVMPFILVLIIIIFAAAAGYFYWQYQDIKKNPNKIAQAENDDLIKKVGKLITLPADETPTIATVLDKEKLKDQPFFSTAENGDKILIYTKAQKAIVYREKDNKLINVGPIAIDQKAQVQIAMINAGGDIDAAVNKINAKFAGTVAISGTTEAANKNEVKKITIIDVSGQNADLASQIASELGGEVAGMPTGETAPAGAAIVVIVK